MCTLCGRIRGLELGQDASFAQLKGPHKAHSEPQGMETTCLLHALSPQTHTRTHSASLPQATLLLTHKQSHPHSSLGENTLTHIHSVFSHPEGHTFKRLSAQKVQRDNKNLPYANCIDPPSEKGGWQVGEKDPWRNRDHVGSGSQDQGHPCLGPLLLPGCPRDTGQGITRSHG